VLRHRQYRLYLSTDVVSNMSQWAFRVGSGWLAWDLTHSGLWLGIVALMSALPFFTILPIAGAFTDRTNPLNIIRFTRSLGILLTLTLSGLTLAGWIDIYLLCALTFLIAINQTFTQPVRLMVAPSLVPREDLSAAIGFNAGVQSSARMVGPAIGGLMIASLGVWSVFLFNAVGFMVSLVGLMSISFAEEDRSSRERGLIGDMIEGWRYAFTHETIGTFITMIFLISIMTRAVLDLFPGFNDDIFNKGPEGLGAIMSSVGVGGVLGSIFISNFSRSKGLVTATFLFMAMTSLLVIAFATTNIFELALACVVGIGFSVTCWQSTTNVLIQLSVDGKMRGRVMSIYALTYRACMSAGAMIAGAFSHWFGLQAPIAVGGVLALIVLALYLPKRRRLANSFEAALPPSGGKPVETPTTNQKKAAE
jgi:predicted MFS family arabinose efflux permease